jgi:hypothetical protein
MVKIWSALKLDISSGGFDIIQILDAKPMIITIKSNKNGPSKPKTAKISEVSSNRA